MKTIVSLAIATLTFAAVPATQAHDHGKKNVIIHSHSSHSCVPVQTYPSHSCAPYFVGTREIGRSIQSQYGYDSHGCLISYNVMLITYVDYYSNGATRTYTRTFRV